MTHLSDEALNEYLDHEDSPEARSQVEAHLAGCPDCAARLVEWSRIFLALAEVPAQPLQRDFKPTVLAQLTYSPIPGGVRWLSLAQFIAALLAGLVFWPVLNATLVLPTLPPLKPFLSQVMAEVLSMQWTLPAIEIPSLELQLSTTTLIAATAGCLLLCLLGNGLLLLPFSRRRT